MESKTVEIEELLPLAERLPKDDHRARLNYVAENGHILFIVCEGKIVGYSEVFVLDRIPDHRYDTNLLNVQGGEYLYYSAMSCERNIAKELFDLGARSFPDCKYIVYHRLRRNNKLNLRRINHA